MSPTLGPYAVDYNRRIVSEVDGTIIAEVSDQDGKPADQVATLNAELLAASWELRDVLADLVECFEEEVEAGDGFSEFHEPHYKRAIRLLQRLGKRDEKGNPRWV